MDSIFLLSSEARSRFLQSTGRALDCLYICIWSYLPYPSNCLICTDGWFHEEDTSVARSLFATYRASLYSVESGYVPGLAYKQRWPYIELKNSDLMDLASMDVQRQFYQEAGVKRAVFMGSTNGEIELGMPSTSNATMQTIQRLFAEDLILQYSQFPADQSRPSSSSSSLRSLSVGSPEYSSLLLSKAVGEPLTQPLSAIGTSQQMTNLEQNLQFPTPGSDDSAIMRAMLAVISSATASASASSSASAQEHQGGQHSGNRLLRSFKPYNAALAPKLSARARLGGHKMIKMGISILRRINLMKAEARVQELRPPTSNQLHHMIAERKRREKINDSFRALKMLLPPGSKKKDKASVLMNAREHMNMLKAQISELEERNRMLALQLRSADDDDPSNEGRSSNERAEVVIVHQPESTSQTQRISLRIAVRVECNMNELVLRVLECLKEMRVVSLMSMNANTFSSEMGIHARINLALQVQASDWEEESLKEAVTRTVDGVLAAARSSGTENQ